MKTVEKLYRQIKKIAKTQEYLELGYTDNLIYLLQKLEFEEWEKLFEIVPSLNQNEQQVITDSIIEIRNNKKSNYDTGLIYAFVFTVSDDLLAECMLENFEFIDNGIPKKVELIDKLLNRLRKLEGRTKNDRNFSNEYSLIDKLYNNAVC